MEQHPIEPAGESVAPLGRQLHRGRQDRRHALGQVPIHQGEPLLQGLGRCGGARRRAGHGVRGLGCAQGGLGSQPLRLQGAGFQGLADLLAGFAQPPSVFGTHQQHGQAQLLGEGRPVDADAKAFGLIGHVEQHHRRQPQFLHLQG